ncbi:MAG TPA: ATP-binding protein [Luteitalea sp.]|nr:ATP-binding protein [Luteitalea sp.]
MDLTHDGADDGGLQQRLARSEERYRLLVDSLTDYAIFMLDADGRVSYWTKAAERIAGYTADQILGMPFDVFFTADDRAEGVPAQELADARRDGRAERVGWRVRKDGTRFWGDEIATALRDDAGVHIGFSKITRDISERRQAELERERLLREATDANRLKDEFLGTISHELRTPLNAIVGWLQLIAIGQDGIDVTSKALPVIERNARTLARLVDDLLDVSRIILGKSVLTFAPVAFRDPLCAAVDTVRPMAALAGVDLQVEHGAGGDTLIADAGRLQQVVWNVLSNAVKFTPRGGTVTVTTRITDEAIELMVADTGAGIDPEFLPFVFDRFRQADAARTHAAGGLGLGLSMVKHWVEQHEGRITVTSEGRGRGTTVCLWLPRRRPDEGAIDIPIVSAPSAHVRAVIVEDDADSRQLLALTLSSHGVEVTAAGSVEEGLAAVRASAPDIIVTDLDLPGQDGFTLLRILRADVDAALHDLPVIALTAYDDQDDRQRSMAAGFNAHLVKPIDLALLVDLVRTHTQSRASAS